MKSHSRDASSDSTQGCESQTLKPDSQSTLQVNVESSHCSKSSQLEFFLRDFYLHIADGNSLLISLCHMRSSGCHYFAASFLDEFKGKLEHVKEIDYCINPLSATPKATFSPLLAKSNYKHIFITGCRLEKSKFVADSLLKEPFKIKTIEDVYIIIPPHQQASYQAADIENLKSDFLREPYTVRVVNTGMNCTLPDSIGAPSSIPDQVISEYKLPETCYGMIYINIAKLNTPEGKKYLDFYFTQVAHVAHLDKASEITVLLIGLSIEEKNYAQNLASKHNITIIHSEKLKPCDFIECMKQITIKNGFIGSDGVQTVRQILSLKGRFFIFNPELMDNNKSYYLSLVNTLPAELKNIGQIILGQSTKYSLLNENHEIMQQTFAYLHLIENRSVEKFKKGKEEILMSHTFADKAGEESKTAEKEFTDDLEPIHIFSPALSDKIVRVNQAVSTTPLISAGFYSLRSHMREIHPTPCLELKTRCKL